MITDNIKNASIYYSLHPAFKTAFESLLSLTEKSEVKKYVIDGEKLFINLSDYTNKNQSECRFESHEKYIDIQYVISGHEQIDACSALGLTLTENKLFSDDIAFFEAPDSFSTADLLPGDFVILFPGEAHRPLVAPGGKSVHTLKAVAKIIAQ